MSNEQDALGKPFVVIPEYRLPKSGNILVKFNHNDSICKLFESNGKAHYTAASKWLNECPRPPWKAFEPCPDMWNEPRLSSRIAERASLRNLRNIDHRFIVGGLASP